MDDCSVLAGVWLEKGEEGLLLVGLVRHEHWADFHPTPHRQHLGVALARGRVHVEKVYRLIGEKLAEIRPNEIVLATVGRRGSTSPQCTRHRKSARTPRCAEGAGSTGTWCPTFSNATIRRTERWRMR